MCMEHPSLRLRTNGEPFLSLDRCRGRCCPVCAPFRARRTGERIGAALASADELRHIVLTMPASTDSLASQLDHLTASFRRLRQTKTWKTHVDGAIATLQVTLPEATGKWHPHLHVLAVGSFFPRELLLEAWSKACGGAEIIWIAPVHNRGTAAKYIASYVAAEDQLTKWPPACLLEFASAMIGRRSVIAVGSMHGSKLPVRDTDDEPKGSTHGCNLRLVARAVRHRVPEALFLRAWCEHNSKWAASMLPKTDEIPGPTAGGLESVPPEQLAVWVRAVADWSPAPPLPPAGRSRYPSRSDPALFRHT